MKGICKSTILASVLFTALSWACTESPDEAQSMPEPGSVSFSTLRNTAAATLNTSVYIFSSPKSTKAYTLTGSIVPLNGTATYRFPNGDLASRDYRFLFVATGSPAETDVSTKSGTPLAAGTPWEDIVLRMLTDTPGTDNYYAVETLTGEQVEATDRINGKLTRTVGQTAYEFTRSSDPSAVVPTDVVSSEVASVLDRVYEIKSEYSGIRKAMSFDAEGKPEPYGATATVVQTITPQYAPGTLTVTVPQTDIGLNLPVSAVKGGVRIMGLCMLPCSNSLSVNMTFSYFDTTPVCGYNHPDGAGHDASCYERRSISLAVPARGAEGLSVYPDTYTVSRAGLPCDRVIDIPETNPINIDFNWNRQ